MTTQNKLDEALYLIALAMLPKIKDFDKRTLLEKHGSASHVFYAMRESEQFADVEWPIENAKKEIDFIQTHSIKLISILDLDYPQKLCHCPDAPILLYYKGNGDFNLPYLISIVGARKHTIYANKIINECIEGMAHLPIGIISGLAQGVDGLAHQKALEKNLPTWAVLGHGLKQIYPPTHRSLAAKMLATGGLLTEFSSDMAPLAFHFPKRNRIVAGMSDATIIIESSLTGGSMITASLALQYNREVFAVPGKIYDSNSAGCLDLVKNHCAQLYHGPEHLLAMLNWPAAPLQKPVKPVPTIALNITPSQKMVLLYIENQGPVHFDNIAARCMMQPGELSTILLHLELEDMIIKMAGGRYARNLP